MATVKFAVVDVNDYLSKKQAADPDLATNWAKLEELYNKKLWHQLTLKLQEMITHPSLQSGDNLIEMYNYFLVTFENKINPLSLVEIVAFIIHQYTDKKEAVKFLEKIEQRVKINDEAVALSKILQGQLYLEHLNDLDATEKIIDELEGSLEDADGVTPVHARFYKLASEYYKRRGSTSKYYRSALRYVGCRGGGSALPPNERQALATQLALAAALAPDVYDLDELLLHPLLDGSRELWPVRALSALAAGDAAGLEAAAAHIPALKEHGPQLAAKRALLRLLHLADARVLPDRRLSFAEISAEARVPMNEVELLVMKALAENLIKGHIDQVGQTVRVQWVRPRALCLSRCAALAARVDQWRASAAAAATLLEANAPDLLTL